VQRFAHSEDRKRLTACNRPHGCVEQRQHCNNDRRVFVLDVVKDLQDDKEVEAIDEPSPDVCDGVHCLPLPRLSRGAQSARLEKW
jgi:hypothetical protein